MFGDDPQMKTNFFIEDMKHLFFLSMLTILAGTQYCAQDTSVKKDAEKIIASCQWTVDDQRLICTVKEKVTEQSVKSPLGCLVPDRIFTVQNEGRSPNEPLLYELRTLDHFVEFILLDDGNLMTIWTGGSALHFNVFSFNKGIVSVVLEEGSRTMPEIAFPGIQSNSSLFSLKETERMSVLIIPDWCWETTNGKSELHPCVAKVYIWDNKSHAYQMESRKWEERFRWPYALAKPITQKTSSKK